MVVFRLTGGNLERIFSLGLLLLLAAARVSLVNGQQGVSLMLSGATIPNDGIVDLDDIRARGNNPPSDADSNGALLCITDLQDCCDAPNVRGEWYFPDDSRVESSATEFRVNRGASVVRLWRRFSAIPGIGRFRCEIPNAANSSISLYANILDFGFRFNVDHVIFSPSTGSTTAGEKDYSLSCSMILFNPVPLPSDVPSPNFQWSFDGSASLPSGVTAMPTVMSSSNSTSETYTNTLQFSSPLSQSLHTGMYTCRLGPGRLIKNVMITVNAPPISAMVTANINSPLMVGQTDNTLTCDVNRVNNLNPTINYRWTRDGVTVQNGSSNVFTFSPFQLSFAGESVYTCHATVGSTLLDSNLDASGGTSQRVEIQIPNPDSVQLTANPSNRITNGTLVTVNCTVMLNPVMMMEDLQLLNVSAWIFRNGTVLTQTSQSVDGTTYNFGATVNSFGEIDNGDYVCIATVMPLSSNQFLTGIRQQASSPLNIAVGLPPTQLQGNTRCYSGSDIAITVVVTTLIECLLAAPIITALLVFCWKRNQRKPQYKSATSTIVQGGEVNPEEDVYEEPDKTAATTAPGKFKLTECPAYVATTSSTLQPAHSTADPQLQSSYYELQ